MCAIDDPPVEQAAEESITPPPAAPKARKAKKAAADGVPAKAKTKAPVTTKKASVKAPEKAKTKVKAKAKAKTRAKRTVDPSKLDEFGYRKGTVRSKAAAMYATKKGATLAEIKEKLGSIQYNVLTELKARGFKRREVEEKNRNGRKVTRYFVVA